MLKRISRLQKPVLKNEEEYQRIQMLVTSHLLKEMMMVTIKAANKLGVLDQSVYEYDEEVGADVISKDFFRVMEKETQSDAQSVGQIIMSGIQSSAVNYAGLVLTGKMNPIYVNSLDAEEERKQTRQSAEEIIEEAGLELAMLGALRETDGGKMVLRDNNRLFDTIKGNYYGKESTKRKVKQCVKYVEQHSKHQSTSGV